MINIFVAIIVCRLDLKYLFNDCKGTERKLNNFPAIFIEHESSNLSRNFSIVSNRESLLLMKFFCCSCSFSVKKILLNKLNFPHNLISFTIDMETVFSPFHLAVYM